MIPLFLSLLTNFQADSLYSQLELEIRTPQVQQSVDLDLYFLRSKGIRMEMSVFGFNAASLLMHDQKWAMLIPSESIALEGQESWIPLGDPQLSPWLNPQNLIPALWGDTSKLAESFKVLDPTAAQSSYEVSKWQKCNDSISCPQSIVFKQGPNQLKLKVSQNNFKPKLSSKLWSLSKPSDFQMVQVPPITHLEPESDTVQQCQTPKNLKTQNN